MKTVEVTLVLMLEDSAKPHKWLPDAICQVLEPGEDLLDIHFGTERKVEEEEME